MNIHELPTLKIDLKDNYVVEAVCKQLDDLILSFEIYNSYIPIDLSSFDIELRALKSDKVPVIQDTDIVITNNKLKIKCNPQLTTSSGVVKAELECIDKITKEKKFSFDIEIEVKPSVLEVNRSISTPTCTLMERLEKDLDKVRDLEFNFNEANKINKELKDTTIPNANKINTTLEENTKKAITSNANLKDSTNTADTAKQAVDSSVVQANASKQALDTSKVNADNTKKEVDNSIKIADEKIEIIKNLDPENIVEDVKKLKEQVLENTLTSIETDNVLTKLDNCENGFVRNMQIKGRTLQNLVQPIKDVTLTKSNNTIILNHNLIKLNTDYSFILDLGNVIDGVSTIHLEIKYKNGEMQYPTFDAIANNIANKITLKKLSFSKEIELIKLAINVSNPSTISVKVNSLMCLEGEPKEIPPYFEGIKSTGELEGNKISILTYGKNIIGDIELGDLGTSGEAVYSELVSRTKNFIRVKENSNYKLSGLSGNSSMICYYDSNKKLTRLAYDTTSITTKTNEIYLKIRFNKTSIPQLEEGVTATSYEPYKEDKTEILLPSPHMGLPSGVADVIDYDKNERIKVIKTGVWNGNENWRIDTITDSEIVFILDNISDGGEISSSKGDIIFNKNIKILASSHNNWYVRIDKAQLETSDVAGFKKLLKTWADAGTPLKFYYPTINPMTEKLNIKDTLQSFENGYIQLDNTITPTAQLEYSTNIPSALGGLTKVVDHNVDEITNIESTISDMDAEIGEARKGKTTLEERLEEDRTNILNTIGQVDVKTDGDIAKQLKDNKNNIEKAVQKKIESTKANLNTLFENGIYRCFNAQIGFPTGYTTDNDFFLINYKLDGDVNPWLRQTLYDLRSSKIFTRQIYNGTLTTWKELATVDDTGWLDLPLLNGATTTSDKALYRRIGKMVYFKGVVNNITTNGFIFGNLPIGFRPNSASGGGNIPVPLFLPEEDIPSRLIIYKNGNLQLSRKNDKNTCYLDGVMFVLD